MSDQQGTDEVDTGKHAAARQQAERAEQGGTRADEALDEALRTDPDGLANVLAQDGPVLEGDGGTASDEEVAAISRTIGTRADSPSRSGITGSGSGADDME